MSDSTPSKLPPELFLRIQCPRCHQFQAVAVTHMAEKLHMCTQCKVTIRLPPLSQKVRGVDEVLKANPGPKPVTMKLCCPGCANILTVSPEVAGHRRRCPTCLEWFRLDLIKEGGQVEIGHSQSPQYEEVNRVTDPQTAAAMFLEIDDETGYSASPTTNSVERPAVRSERQPSRGTASSHNHRSPPPPPIVDDREDLEPEEEDDLPVLVERSEMRYQTHVVDHSKWPLLPFRLIYRTLVWTLWLASPLFFIWMAGNAFRDLFMVLALVWFFIPGLCVRFANFIMTVCFRWIRCPGCRQVQSPVGRWFCNCGYHSPYELNIFKFRCPLCRKFCGHFNCPQCDSTMLIK